MLKARPPPAEAAAETVVAEQRRVTARHPNHVWHVDLTVVPTPAGFWIPWLPHARPQHWPFCWWLAVAVDNASRLCVGFTVFAQRPSSRDSCAFLNRAIKSAGGQPKHIISDRGSQFECPNYKSWCRWRRIRVRFGAVGQHGSIAIVERFIRSMEAECTRPILVPFRLPAMRAEIAWYIGWYNAHRPHNALGGRTPLEVYRALPPANQAARFEPRRRWPRKSRCASPVAPIRGRRGARLKLLRGPD